MAKYIVNSNGILAEATSVGTSAGAGDSTKIPHLNGSGILDPTIVNSTPSSAGAGSAGKLPALDSSGKLDSSFLPVGIGADTQSITASEALAAGDFVNVWSSTGAKARKADATTAGKHAMGFVLSAVANGAQATVYFEGTNTQVSGQTPGDVFLSTTPGQATTTCPSATGNIAQPVGIATSATTVNFQYNRPITLL
ncbi:MAG: hypothetical protein RLZZ450_73 [Pseudomonadota bacterium]|jgi:hypothetical protein